MAITDIRNLEPQGLWKNFYGICQIPHPSHHLDAITKHIVDWAKNLNLDVKVDKVGNILVRKDATPGMEHCQTVILQAHSDMVPQKNNDKVHDFTKDPIDTVIDGEWVKANGTTLGADNGIGVAAGMAVLESTTLKHGPLELLITSDEETGMYGAFGLEPGFLKGSILLNMDSEDEGELYVGCAGGVDANIAWNYQSVETPSDDIAMLINIKGLKGGHSGLEINEGRANANKLLFRFLKDAIANEEARLATVEGGNMRNAIPREANAVITIPADAKEDIENLVAEYCEMFNEEYNITENEIIFTCKETALPANIIPEEIQDDIINAVTACPNGVFRMIPAMPSIVETSMNLSIIRANAEETIVQCLLRSSVDSKKEELASMVESIFTMAGAKVEFSGSYSGWNPNLDSTILGVMREAYEKQFGNAPEVKVIHAGLECGIIGATHPGLDMISIGPTIRSPHSPDERINIASVPRFWDFLTATLENMK